MERHDLLRLVLDTLDDFASMMPDGPPDAFDESTALFGPAGLFDSIGLVTFLTDLEEQVNDEADAAINVADERALSAEKSPFRSIGSLVDHLSARLSEE